MPSCRILIPLLIFIFCSGARAGENRDQYKGLGLVAGAAEISASEWSERPGPLARFSKIGSRIRHFNRKTTAAILAFPFPFGIVGLHRIYLGCQPYIPVVYIASLGGAFGVLPLLDFIAIISAKDVERFSNSGKVFMWVE